MRIKNAEDRCDTAALAKMAVPPRSRKEQRTTMHMKNRARRPVPASSKFAAMLHVQRAACDKHKSRSALCLSIGRGCGSSPRREGGRRCSLQPCDSIFFRFQCSPLRREPEGALAGWSPSSGGEERGGWRAGALERTGAAAPLVSRASNHYLYS